MIVIPYEPDLAPSLVAAYDRSLAGVPHCYPVPVARMASALATAAAGAEPPPHPSGRSPHPRVPLRAGAAWLSLEGDDVIGLIHVAVAPAGEPAGIDAGAIRALWYERGRRAVGQALLDVATDHLRAQGVARIDAYRYEHRLPFFHVEHAYLSWRLEHVHALLGANGYHRIDGELVLDWPDFAADDPGEPPVEVGIDLEWTPSLGARRGLIVHAVRGSDEVGVCVGTSGGEYAAAEEAEDWVYIAWLTVDEGLRGRGLGRYLLLRALHEARAAGYRHASLCCIEHNHRALLLYTGLGFRVVDWTWAWSRDIGE